MISTNPFKYIIETTNSPHAQVLRTSYWTKLKETFFTFNGNVKSYKIWLITLRQTWSLALKQHEQYNKNREDLKALYQGQNKLGLFSWGLTRLPRYILNWIPIKVIQFSLWLQRRKSGFMLSAFAHILMVASLVAINLLDTALMLTVKPLIMVASLALTVLVSPIVLAVELFSLPRALKWKALFLNLPFRTIREIHHVGDDPTIVLSHEQVLSKIWSHREAYTRCQFFGSEGLLPARFGFYRDDQDPINHEPDFILTVEDIVQNSAAFRAMLHLNMFRFLAENEAPAYPYLSEEEKQAHPFKEGGPDGQRPNYLLSWLSKQAGQVIIDLSSPLDLDAELGNSTGYQRV